MKLELCVFNRIASPLSQYENNVTSQSGEDGIIAHIAQVLDLPKYCVEFGACDGRHNSNCYNLVANCGWHGILIESDPQKYQELARTYQNNPRATTVNRLVDMEGANSLDNILEEFSAPREIGVMSIDIDGNDYYVWESLIRHSPELIVIEFNVTITNDVLFV